MATTTIHNSILAYNKELIESNHKITIKEYIHQINNIHYNIDISFIDELFDVVTRNDCCIPHTYLLKYKISKLSNGSNDALKLFDKNL